MPQRMLIVDDHPMFATALTYASHAVDPAMTVVTAGTLADAERELQQAGFALILLDLMLPDVQGLAGLALVRALAPSTPVALVTSREDPELVGQAVRLGLRGFMAKTLPMDQIVRAIRVLLAGGQWLPDAVLSASADAGDLSERLGELSLAQLKVLRAMASGRQNKQIAHDLGLAEPTVKSHLAAIFRKLGVTNRTQAVLALRGVEGQTA